MSTRLKRSSFWRQICFAAFLVSLQGYFGYSVVSGQFGIDSQRRLEQEIAELSAHSALLQVEIDAMSHRTALFTPERLDPDIVSERARGLLSMSQPDDLIVMLNRITGKPANSSFDEFAASRLTGEIEAGID